MSCVLTFHVKRGVALFDPRFVFHVKHQVGSTVQLA